MHIVIFFFVTDAGLEAIRSPENFGNRTRG